jgi:hypothetical protein
MQLILIPIAGVALLILVVVWAGPSLLTKSKPARTTSHQSKRSKRAKITASPAVDPFDHHGVVVSEAVAVQPAFTDSAPSPVDRDSGTAGPSQQNISVPANSTKSEPPACQGAFSQYAVGDPGRTRSRIVPKLDLAFLDVPDSVLDGAVILDTEQIPRFDLRAASVRGLSHRHYGVVRQDSYGIELSVDGKFLILAVADGVSAGKLSHKAAEIATTKIPDAIKKALVSQQPSEIEWNQLVHDSAVLWMQGWIAHEVELGRLTQQDFGLEDLEEPEFLETLRSPRVIGGLMASTVALAIVDLTMDDTGAHDVWFTRIGDTSGWIISTDTEGKHHWESLGDVKNEGEAIAESATVALPFLPKEPLEAIYRKLKVNERLVLMTDGIGDPLGSGTGLTGDAFGTWWVTAPSTLEFAAQVDFDRVTFDDDRTAIAIWPIER